MRSEPDANLVDQRDCSYVFSVAVLYPVSLTPRFSEVRGRIWYHNPESFRGLLLHCQKTAEAVGLLSGVVNTQLKQGVNEMLGRR